MYFLDIKLKHWALCQALFGILSKKVYCSNCKGGEDCGREKRFRLLLPNLITDLLQGLGSLTAIMNGRWGLAIHHPSRGESLLRRNISFSVRVNLLIYIWHHINNNCLDFSR